MGFHIPGIYRQFLLGNSKRIVFGMPLLGLPANDEINSVLGATNLLRAFRPECTGYLVIRILDERVLCLDLGKVNGEDAALVEISLSSTDPPKLLGRTFQSYWEDSITSEKEISDGLDRLRTLIERNNSNGLAYNHTDKKVPFKARHWRAHRCCVHDKVVGLTTFRYNEAFNGIEVDTFLSTDHPDYEEGHGTKALIALILSDAYKNGTGMEVRFRQNRLPRKLALLLGTLGIKLQYREKGVLAHEESVSLYSSLLGINSETKQRIAELEKNKELSLQGICFLINSRVWTADEVNWLICNVPRLRALLFGKDAPENRLNYAESLSYGRAALAMTKLKEKIQTSSDNDTNEAEISVNGQFQIFKTLKPCSIDWLPGSKPLELEAGESIIVLCRPRSNWINCEAQMEEDIKAIQSENGRKFILYTSEILTDPHFEKIMNGIQQPSEDTPGFLMLPYTTTELNTELISKMKKARRYRA